MRELTFTAALIAIGFTAFIDAQMADRLKGAFRSTTGATPAGVSIRAAAIDDLRGIARVQSPR